MTSVTPSRHPWLFWSLRAAILVIVLFAVRGTVRNALDELSKHQWHVHPAWLAAAGLIYVMGLVPMAWFWHRALAALGQPAPWPAVLRAYFFGHLGKYVPGKALAILLRVAAVRRWVISIRIAVVSSLLETLTMMAVGAFLAAALAVVVLRLEPRIAAFAGAVALLVGLPTLPPVARRLARFGVQRLKDENQNASDMEAPIPADIDASLHGINVRLLATGWLAAALCWVLLGLSLWTTLRSMGILLDPLGDLPLLVAAVALAVVAGFASMLPGGLGVRDALLMQLLTPTCGAANALVAALFMRLVWLVSELVACVILYVAARFR
jgi:uncharacterized membrane protein YbhN (UPF0104 family)